MRFQEDLSEELAEHMKHQIEERKTPSPDMHMMSSRVTSSLQPIGSDIEALELGILIIKYLFGIVFMAYLLNIVAEIKDDTQESICSLLSM